MAAFSVSGLIPEFAKIGSQKLSEDISSSGDYASDLELLFVYSDGVTDLLDIKHQAFGIKNLERFLQSFDDKDSKKLIEDLLKKLKEFSKDIFQYDDISLFSIFFK